VLINVNITDITDEAGYIDAIGQKAASQAIQQARGDVADQERMGETRVAEAERDKTIQISNAAKEKEIGMKAAMREQTIRIAELEKEKEIGIKGALPQQAIKIAEFEKEQKIGEQTAAYQRDVQIKEAEREMRVKTADANAKAITGENTAQEAVAISKANLSVKQTEAYQIAETKKREAEAAVLEAQNRAMAKAALADADRVEAERRAALEAPAKAEKAKMIVDAEASAERRRIEAEGDASAIFAKLDAEARGQYEILAKKAAGLQKIVEACGGSHQAFQMLMLDHLNHLTDASAKAISNIKFDKIVVWENGGKDGSSNTANFLQNMARTLPPMMQVMRDVAGIELPETLLKVTPDGEPSKSQAAAEADDSALATTSGS
jgi:flotillin